MQTSKELIEELQFNDKYLCDTYKDSKYYREYLKKVFFELLNLTKKET